MMPTRRQIEDRGFDLLAGHGRMKLFVREHREIDRAYSGRGERFNVTRSIPVMWDSETKKIYNGRWVEQENDVVQALILVEHAILISSLQLPGATSPSLLARLTSSELTEIP